MHVASKQQTDATTIRSVEAFETRSDWRDFQALKCHRVETVAALPVR